VRYRDLCQPEAPRAGGLTKDLSAGGLRFQVTRGVSPGSRLLIQVTVPGTPAPIRTIALVIWTHKQPDDERWDVGVQFVGVTPQDRGVLADYVAHGPPRANLMAPTTA